MDLLGHKSTERHGVHHPVLVVAQKNGRGALGGQVLESLQAMNAEIAAETRPNQNAGEAVVDVAHLDGRCQDGALTFGHAQGMGNQRSRAPDASKAVKIRDIADSICLSVSVASGC